MPRPPRIQLADRIYHVTTRGNRGQRIVTGERDATRFFLDLVEVSERHGWRCHAYCVMTNHYHLLVETPKPDLSAGMHRLNTRYSHWFNRYHEVQGHLFERRFNSVLIEGTEHLLEVLRYIPLNPVRAGLCDDPAAWRWSSYRATAGLARPPSFLAVDRVLALFGEKEERARRRFVSFVRSGIATAA